MRSTNGRRAVLAMLGAGALTACTAPQRLGDARKPPVEGGIGGTGIVGVVTDFGSLMVNGLRVGVPADAAATNAFGPIDPAEVRIGDATTIEASVVDGVLAARRVHVAHPVIGRVDHVSAGGRRGGVAGVAVDLEPGALGSLALGARVAVSGLWRGDTVVATKVTPAPSGAARDVLAGEVRIDARGEARVGGVALRTVGRTPEAGVFVTAVGQSRHGAFRADTVRVGRFFGAAGPLSALSVEGWLEPQAKAPFFAVSGLGHSFDPDAKLTAFDSARAIFAGGYDGRFVAETGLALPEDFDRRRLALRAVAADPAAAPTRPTR